MSEQPNDTGGFSDPTAPPVDPTAPPLDGPAPQADLPVPQAESPVAEPTTAIPANPTEALPVPPPPTYGATPPEPPTANPYAPPSAPYGTPPPPSANPYATPPAAASTPYGQPEAYGTPQPPAYGAPQAPYGQAAYPQAPYGQVPYGQPSPYTTGSTTNTSGIVLLIASIVGTLACCIPMLPSLVFGILSVTKQSTDPEGSRRMSKFGWIAFGVGFAVGAILLTLVVVNGYFTTSSSGYNY